MPKIIENLRESLLAEAREQVARLGYGATTVRSVAKACGVGVGTLYNYFPSKDMLIASFMLQDWQACLEEVRAFALKGAKAREFLHKLYNALLEFSEAHKTLFRDPGALQVFSSVFASRHTQLRAQLAQMLLPYCAKEQSKDQEFLAQFVAEAVLTWSNNLRPFEDVWEVLHHLL